MIYPGFAGPSAATKSPNEQSERTINLYLERPPGQPKATPVMIGTPGLTPGPGYALASAPGRGLYAQDGRAWSLAGAVLYELGANGVAQIRGFTEATSEPATWACNGETAGHQLIHTSGGVVYLLDLVSGIYGPIPTINALGPIQSVDFAKGYFLALNVTRNIFYVSPPENGIPWDAAQANQVSDASNALRRLLANRSDVWLFGNRTSSVWGATGDLNQPFAPVLNTVIPYGTSAAFSPCVFGSSVCFIGESASGHGVVIRMNGYTPEIISNPAVETFLQDNTPRLPQAVCFTYQMNGHEWYVISIPDKDTAWQVDERTGVWTELGRYEALTGAYSQPRVLFHAFAFDRHLVADRLTGTVYDWSLDTTIDTIVTP